MVGFSAPASTGSLGGQVIARVVGFTCLIGYLFDMAMLAFPLGSGAGWRATLLQQMGDRSIVLFLGLAFILYSFWDNKALRKPFAYAAMAIGVFFLLLSLLVIRDTLTLQGRAVETIGTQATELQTQIEQNRNNPELATVTPQDFEDALRQVDTQAETLKQNAKTSLTKAGIASLGNFIVVGIGLLSLGRVGVGAGSASPAGGSVKKSRKLRQ